VTYVQPDIVVDEAQIAQTAYDLVAARVPGWQPSPNSLDTALLEAAARLAAELRSLVGDVSDLVVQGLATSILDYPRRDAEAAQLDLAFTLTAGAAGYVVPAGTQVAVLAPDGTQVAFRTVADSATVGTAATAPAEAVETGPAGNGISGAASMIDALPQVDSVAAVGTSAGGADAEADLTYLDRIARRMRLVAVHPILPADFALLATDVPGVARAMALDGYDPVANTTGNIRTVAVVVQDAAGLAVPGGVKADVAALLGSSREVGFVVNVADPLYEPITLVVDVVKTAQAVTAQVVADVQAALSAYLSPARWGAPAGEGEPAWSSRPTVYLNQLIAVAGSVPGVVRVAALPINGVAADKLLQAGKPQALPLLTGPPTVNVT
jgi:uncharacterized phage protein gp47/JayE